MDEKNTIKTGPAGENQENQAEKPNRWKKAAVILSLLAAILVLAAVGAGLFLWYSGSVRGSMFAARGGLTDVPARQTQSPAPQEGETLIDADWIDENGNAYNYRDNVISLLLMGVDYMADESHWESGMLSNGGNADVLALVILNTDTLDFKLLYIPRDTMAEVIAMDETGNYIDTVRTNIATAHSYGDGKELSCRLTVDAVSRLLYGVPINRYAALNYDAIYTINDIIGGLTITFDADYSYIHPTYTQGNTVTMSSWQLRRFIVYRDKSQTEGAYERGVRDMEVLKALFEQCREKIGADPTLVLEIMDKLGGNLTTDLSIREISFLAQNIRKLSFQPDTLVKLQGEVGMGETYAEFIPDEDWLHDFVVDSFCESVS